MGVRDLLIQLGDPRSHPVKAAIEVLSTLAEWRPCRVEGAD